MLRVITLTSVGFGAGAFGFAVAWPTTSSASARSAAPMSAGAARRKRGWVWIETCPPVVDGSAEPCLRDASHFPNYPRSHFPALSAGFCELTGRRPAFCPRRPCEVPEHLPYWHLDFLGICNETPGGSSKSGKNDRNRPGNDQFLRRRNGGRGADGSRERRGWPHHAVRRRLHRER